MKKQVLHIFPGIWAGGGPAGYAYNLKEALKSYGSDAPIVIMSPSLSLYKSPTAKMENENREPRWSQFKCKLKESAPRIYGIIVTLIGYSRFRKLLNLFTEPQVSEMKSSQVLVFHEWRLAYAYLGKIGRQKGQRIFLMPHSPVEWTREYVESLKYYYGTHVLWEFVYRFYIQKETVTWQACDGIIVPSRYSLEAYFNGRLDKYIGSIPVIEIPTGIKELVAFRSPWETRRIWGISPEARVCGFFGRRHPHKGYDIFCQIAHLAFHLGHNLTFVSAGDGPLPWPNLPNFLHLGYLSGDEIANAISACDIVIVPNRVNYFDLIILEAMCLGKPVVTTKVGGAKHILSPGVFLVDLSESIADELESWLFNHLASNQDTLSAAGRANRLVYEKQFSAKAFGERHRKLALDLLGT